MDDVTTAQAMSESAKDRRMSILQVSYEESQSLQEWLNKAIILEAFVESGKFDVEIKRRN